MVLPTSIISSLFVESVTKLYLFSSSFSVQILLHFPLDPQGYVLIIISQATMVVSYLC